eukprot:CAMPEP_0178433490 /NCGR_PEP_ID=MMETSP0689_2-20121128/32932_1 /TAXON_ID=160604 /ORGANISM="Amphidinium massartii, Strain CS-259" /LENGTH=257 /DNA_ID=CAMNT_0020055519 /DNA_START=97 /DNA_END=870 /DNA_ORIENTATION=-
MCMKVPAGSPGTTIQLEHPYLPGGAPWNNGLCWLAPTVWCTDLPLLARCQVLLHHAAEVVLVGCASQGELAVGEATQEGALQNLILVLLVVLPLTCQLNLELCHLCFQKLATCLSSWGNFFCPAEEKESAIYPPEAKEEAKAATGEWSTGSKVAVGAVLAAAAAGGVIAADIATEGAMGEMLADGVEDAVDWVEEAGEDAVEWTEGAVEDVAEWADDAGVVDAAEDAGEWIVEAAEDAAEWIDEAADDVGDFIMDLF